MNTAGQAAEEDQGQTEAIAGGPGRRGCTETGGGAAGRR